MVIKGRTHEELWQIIIQNSLIELVNEGFNFKNKKVKTNVIEINQNLRVVKVNLHHRQSC